MSKTDEGAVLIPLPLQENLVAWCKSMVKSNNIAHIAEDESGNTYWDGPNDAIAFIGHPYASLDVMSMASVGSKENPKVINQLVEGKLIKGIAGIDLYKIGQDLGKHCGIFVRCDTYDCPEVTSVLPANETPEEEAGITNIAT